MKNHKEMFEALLSGETLVSNRGTPLELYMLDGNLNDVARMLGSLTPEWWQIKPKTININGFEVPEPVREKPLDGTIYYIVTLDFPNSTLEWLWSDDDSDRDYIKKGIAHLTKEAAELHAKALLSFTAKESLNE